MTFLAGDEPTAGQVEELRGLRVYKLGIETVNGSAALQNDDELFLTVEANAKYRFMARILFTSNTTADFKFGFTYPSGATATYTLLGIASGGASLSAFHQVESSGGALEGGTGIACLMFGTWAISSTAGVLQLQWAQNTSNASNTQVLAGSFLELVKFS